MLVCVELFKLGDQFGSSSLKTTICNQLGEYHREMHNKLKSGYYKDAKVTLLQAFTEAARKAYDLNGKGFSELRKAFVGAALLHFGEVLRHDDTYEWLTEMPEFSAEILKSAFAATSDPKVVLSVPKSCSKCSRGLHVTTSPGAWAFAASGKMNIQAGEARFVEVSVRCSDCIQTTKPLQKSRSSLMSSFDMPL
jgi:hypothetical protein